MNFAQSACGQSFGSKRAAWFEKKNQAVSANQEASWVSERKKKCASFEAIFNLESLYLIKGKVLDFQAH